MQHDRFEKRLIFFAGKGGVGKTSLSAAVALAHAKRGRRTLLVELGGTESAPPLFGHEGAVGYTPKRLVDGVPLYSCHLTPPLALEEYGVMKLRFKGLYRLVFENDFMHRLLDWVPGMDDLLIIGKIWFLEQERRPSGRVLWDRIVVDAPATGHGVGLLQLPGVILDAVKTGPLATDTRPILEMLQDRTRAVVHLVSLAEELPVRETWELAERVRHDLGLALGVCFVNKIWPDAYTGQERRILDRFAAAVRGRNDDLDGLLDRVGAIRRRQGLQRRYTRLLGERLGGMPLVEVPYLFSDTIGPKELDVLSTHMGKEPVT